MQVKKGDMVYVKTGKDAGKRGKVLRVIPKTKKVLVEGINQVKRHQKPNRKIPQGGILTVEAAMDASNVMVVCNKCNKPTRVGHKRLDNKEKVRCCKKCGEILD
ncbi:MAG: 50S ribosomal protein L24 [Syntrophomonadaceae bacterium]|jgi:large subunit ribosomal protein L24